MEALTVLCVLGALLPFAHAQTNGLVVSSGSLVTIVLVCALPVTAIICIWTFFFYCICKNEYDYRKIYKELEKKEHYLKRKQQRIRQAQQLNASGYYPAPLQFSHQPKAQHKIHPSNNIPQSALGSRTDHERGRGRVHYGPYASSIPHDSSRSKEPAIARLPPHIGYQHLTEELRQQQHRQLQASKRSGGGHEAGPRHAVDSHGYASNTSSPFSFQHISPSSGFTGRLPAKDYPQSKTSAHSSNSSAFGQLSTWPKFN